MRAPLFASVVLVAIVACGEPRSPPGNQAHWNLWSPCLRDSDLPGVERETSPGLDLEIDGVRVVTGTLGQRGSDAEPTATAVRIAAVGGELTFGAGLSAEQAWPQALAAQLDRSILTNGRDVAALNLGTVFASITDVLGIATRRALAWEPHLLIVELDTYGRGDAADEELAAALRDLRVAAGGIECGVLVVVATPLHPGWRDERDEAEASALLAAADRAGLATLDLRQTFAGHAPEQLLDDAQRHSSAKAQELVLEAVKQALFHSGLLGQALDAD